MLDKMVTPVEVADKSAMLVGVDVEGSNEAAPKA
jgi:hypothetical protein